MFLYYNAYCTGATTNPQEEVKIRRNNYNLVPEMQNFPIVTSSRPVTISVWHILGGPGGC